jgi:hypothetical protein
MFLIIFSNFNFSTTPSSGLEFQNAARHTFELFFLDGWTEHLVAPFLKRPTNAQGSSGFLLIRSEFFYPDMFRHMVAILRGLGCLISCSSNVLGTGHSPHTPITQNIAWVAYQTLTTPWGWKPYAETFRSGNIRNVLIKIHYFLEHLLVFLQTFELLLRTQHKTESTLQFVFLNTNVEQAIKIICMRN